MLLVFLIVLSVLIFFRLFRAFGNPEKIIVSMDPEDREKLKELVEKVVSTDAQRGNSVKSADKPSKELVDGIVSLQAKIPDFSLSAFLAKADGMFDTVFDAFANSRHIDLKAALSSELYESFASQMKRREEKNLRQELKIKHKKTTLDKIQMLAEKVRMFVTFEVSQMSAMIDVDCVSPDNPKRLYREVIHKWIFEREFDKNSWILSKLSSAEV